MSLSLSLSLSLSRARAREVVDEMTTGVVEAVGIEATSVHLI